jgi:hypothetical protein
LLRFRPDFESRNKQIHATVPVKLEPIQTNRSDITVSTDNRPPAPAKQPDAEK